MQNPNKAKLTEGPIKSMLVRLTAPMVVGIVSVVVFNLVDTWFVSLLGTAELAAISFTFPVVIVLGSLALGLGIGTSAVVSRAIGGGDHARVQRLTTDSLTLAVIIVAFFVVLGLLTIEPVFTLLGATPELMPLIKEYMTIWYLGMIFIVVPMVGNNAIRATGDTKTPSVVMLIAAGANALLDPIFIFGFGPIPRMELAGAAIATVLARAITFFVAIWVLQFRDKMITYKIPGLKTGIKSWWSILYIGIPAAATNMIVPIGIGIVTSMLAVYGPRVVAGFGVASRIELFAITVVMALGAVLSPFVGQNWGAGKTDRMKLGVRYSQQFSMLWGAATFVLFLLLAQPLANLFTDDPLVSQTIVAYLWLVPISYGLVGMLTLSNTALNVLNKPLHAALLSVIRIFVLYVPLAYAGSALFGVLGIFAAISMTNIIAGSLAWLWLRRVLTNVDTPALADTPPVAHSFATPKPAQADG